MEAQLVVFKLGGESFGIEIDAVESIIKMQPITVVPHAPDFICGVTNLRGTVLPVIDLRVRFSLPAAAPTRDTRIVVVALDNFQVGMLVDGVSQVKQVSEEQIEPAANMAYAVRGNFIRGIANLDDGLVILLDLRQALTIGNEEFSERRQTPQAAPRSRSLAAA
jgi:purine-binding chemotaxis protein CheW